jgi:hypothetical protein
VEKEYQLMVKLKELHESGTSLSDMIREVRHDDLWISKSLAIMRMPQEILDSFARGELSRTAAEALSGLPSEKVLAVFHKAQEIHARKK